MGNSPTPPGLLERIMNMVDERIARFAGSGFLRNATISEGGLTIKGGFLRLRNALNTFNLFYVGPVAPSQPDGTPQQGWVVRRADGTTVLLLRDAFPEDGPSGLNQALTWLDRSGNVVVSDDTDSGEGGARPWLPMPLPKPTAVASWPSTTATAWGNIAECITSMERPKVWWSATAVTDAGVSGQVRLSINGGAILGPIHDVVAGTTTFINDHITLPDGYFGQQWQVDVSAQVTAGAGSIRCQTWALYGRQT